MPNYRRVRLPGATYFFTVNLYDRISDLLVMQIDKLRSADGRHERSDGFISMIWITSTSIR